MTRQHNNRLIFLTGFMASGKSTIGPILANCLGFSHVDLDHEIESAEGATIRQLFIEKGEIAFRAIENAKLKEVSGYDGYVVSLGGGTALQEENFRLIQSTGFLIYLKTDSEHLFRRLKNKRDRPMLQTVEGESLSDHELRLRIESLLAAREAIYGKADLIVHTDNKPVGRTVDEIVKLMQKFL
jgi:shikimate kinase